MATSQRKPRKPDQRDEDHSQGLGALVILFLLVLVFAFLASAAERPHPPPPPPEEPDTETGGLETNDDQGIVQRIVYGASDGISQEGLPEVLLDQEAGGPSMRLAFKALHSDADGGQASEPVQSTQAYSASYDPAYSVWVTSKATGDDTPAFITQTDTTGYANAYINTGAWPQGSTIAIRNLDIENASFRAVISRPNAEPESLMVDYSVTEIVGGASATDAETLAVGVFPPIRVVTYTTRAPQSNEHKIVFSGLDPERRYGAGLVVDSFQDVTSNDTEDQRRFSTLCLEVVKGANDILEKTEAAQRPYDQDLAVYTARQIVPDMNVRDVFRERVSFTASGSSSQRSVEAAEDNASSNTFAIIQTSNTMMPNDREISLELNGTCGWISTDPLLAGKIVAGTINVEALTKDAETWQQPSQMTPLAPQAAIRVRKAVLYVDNAPVEPVFNEVEK